jgi:hypothetical protein
LIDIVVLSINSQQLALDCSGKRAGQVRLHLMLWPAVCCVCDSAQCTSQATKGLLPTKISQYPEQAGTSTHMLSHDTVHACLLLDFLPYLRNTLMSTCVGGRVARQAH